MTTLRAALAAGSALQQLVEDGLQALATAHVRQLIDADIRDAFDDSIDLDSAFVAGRANENRWDYLLGHEESGKVVALEPHTAANHEVSTVIKKRSAALIHVRGHLRPGVAVSKWFWVASGKVDFVPVEKAVLRLDQNGITFVGRKLLRKHLPSV